MASFTVQQTLPLKQSSVYTDNLVAADLSLSPSMSSVVTWDQCRLVAPPSRYGFAETSSLVSGQANRISFSLGSSFVTHAVRGAMAVESGASFWEQHANLVSPVCREQQDGSLRSSLRDDPPFPPFPPFSREAGGIDAALRDESGGGREQWSAGLAIAAALGAASSTMVKVVRPQQGHGSHESAIISTPSEDFVALCQAQLELFARTLALGDHLTAYVRTPESYASGQLELRCVACHPDPHPGAQQDDIILLVSDLEAEQTGRTAETALVAHEAVELPERGALVLPLAKGTFMVGLLVVERFQRSSSSKPARPQAVKAVRPVWPPSGKLPLQQESLTNSVKGKSMSTGTTSRKTSISHSSSVQDQFSGLVRQTSMSKSIFSAGEQEEAAKVAHTLALACVLDQRALLVQQTAWQKAALMDTLLEEVRGPLVAFRALGHMLLPQLRQGELSRDIVDAMLLQGDRMKDIFDELQQAVYPAQGVERLTSYEDLAGDSGLDTIPGSGADKLKLIPPQQLLPPPSSTRQLPLQKNLRQRTPSLEDQSKN